MKFLGRSLLIGLFVFAQNAFAVTGGTSTLFLNGVQNTRAQAFQNMLAIKGPQISEKAESGRGGVARYGLLYNATDGVGDFIEVMKQKLQEQYAISASYTQLWLWALRAQQPTQQFIDIESAYFNNLEVARRIISVGGADVSQQKADLVAELKAGNRTLVVAHSQGTLFANTLYTSVFASRNSQYCEKNVGSVFAGAAAGNVVSSRVPGHGAWFTFSDDIVIQGLRLASSTLGISILPSNNGFFGENRTRFGADTLGHGFKDAYMLADSRYALILAAEAMAKRLVYPASCGGSIFDISPQVNDNAALADLIDDSNNVDPTPVEPGKPLYLEGSGLGGAQFVVPGVPARLSASAVNLPTDHPLYVSGAEVWKLTIPSSAVAGSTGVIRAIISIDGVEQNFESPRSVKVSAPARDWEIRRKGYALNPNQSVQIGNYLHSCPSRGEPEYFREVATGFVGTVVETVAGISEEKVSPYNYGFNGLDSSFCYYIRVNNSGYTNTQASASMLNQHTWETRSQSKYYEYTTQTYEDYFMANAWNVEGYIKQVRRLDGQCDRITYRSKCLTGTNSKPVIGQLNTGTSCPWPHPPQTQVVTCKARPDWTDHQELWRPEGKEPWRPEGSLYIMAPHFSSNPVTMEPVLRLEMN